MVLVRLRVSLLQTWLWRCVHVSPAASDARLQLKRIRLPQLVGDDDSHELAHARTVNLYAMRVHASTKIHASQVHQC